MKLQIPHTGIVLLIGPSNSGKSTFLKDLLMKKVIMTSEVVSSDDFRLMVSDIDFVELKNRSKDESDALQDLYKRISIEAFALMDTVVEARCRLNKLTFVDATHLQHGDRKKYIDIARRNHVPIVAIVMNIPEDILLTRDSNRDQPRGIRRVKQQYLRFIKERKSFKDEGFSLIYYIDEYESPSIVRRKNPLELNVGEGIDFIGDINGCYNEMILLLSKLGYRENDMGLFIHLNGRKFVSIGNVIGSGPESLKSIIFLKRHVDNNLAYMVDSSNGFEIANWINEETKSMNIAPKLASDFESYKIEYGIEKLEELKEELKQFLFNSPSHYVFTENGVQIAVGTHAGIKDHYIGKQSPRISDFCRSGDNSSEEWYLEHKTNLLIVWGHYLKQHPLIENNTVNINQGAVYGGNLTAFRYPEREVVSIKSAMNYSGEEKNPLIELESKRLVPPNIHKLIDGYRIQTESFGSILVYPDLVRHAIETVSHSTIPIEQMVYIPPTTSPTPYTSKLDCYLEHPGEAFDYYRSNGVSTMIAMKKNMGSRGVLFLFKDIESAVKYTGIESLGIIYSSNGSRFFEEKVERILVSRIVSDLVENNYFKKYETDFVLIDVEIMPWNIKAKEQISLYSNVSESAILDRSKLMEKMMFLKNPKLQGWIDEYNAMLENAKKFKKVFQDYGVQDEEMGEIQIESLYIIAHSGKAFFDKPQTWHIEMGRELASYSSLFIETEFKLVNDVESETGVIEWWKEIACNGFEGIVIKPDLYINDSELKIYQPAIKVRGRDFLRIVYGMDYLLPDNLKRLKKRKTSKKQKQAINEFSLGVEGIRRFVAGESLERVHECVLGVLAQQADQVDPRL
ncbi:MAG: polynucleotide kinasephosphatase [Bacillales bacterium]|jgi:polynucleotide kinase-phosphatase|nr:polynucleotide kinasephosphatase [Bacillales bacterium]